MEHEGGSSSSVSIQVSGSERLVCVGARLPVQSKAAAVRRLCVGIGLSQHGALVFKVTVGHALVLFNPGITPLFCACRSADRLRQVIISGSQVIAGSTEGRLFVYPLPVDDINAAVGSSWNMVCAQ